MGLVLACNQGASKIDATPQADKAASDSVIFATLNGNPITEADIEDRVAGQLRQVRMDMYAARKAGVDQIIAERLLEAEAGKQGVVINEFLKKEIADKIAISDKDVADYYEKVKARFQGKPFDEVKGLIRNFLSQQEFQKAQGALLAKLRKKADINILITPPRVEVEAGDHPSMGPENAPIQIVEFSDYQCPFCGRVRDTVHKVVEKYGKKVHYVFRDFPLAFHKEAPKAHEAAHCAGEQGKYWEYNDKLFNSQQNLKVDDLKKYAKEFKIKAKEFDECLDSGKYAKMVADSLRYGQTVGVSGTPAFFVNGRMVSGAQPFEAFQEIIEDELSRNN
jgi:protein-disulfide isomerase